MHQGIAQAQLLEQALAVSHIFRGREWCGSHRHVMPRQHFTGAVVFAVVGGLRIGFQAGEQGVIDVRREGPKAADDRLRSGGAGRHGALTECTG